MTFGIFYLRVHVTDGLWVCKDDLLPGWVEPFAAFARTKHRFMKNEKLFTHLITVGRPAPVRSRAII